MNETRDENSQDGQITDDENHNYLQSGLEPVDAANDDDVQMLGKSENQPLALVPVVPSPGTETNNVLLVQKEAQATKNNYTNVEQEEKRNSVTSDNEEALNEKDVSSQDNKLVAPVLYIKNNKGGIDMVWEDLRPKFPCDKCSYGAKKRYLLKRHQKTHRDKSHAESKKCNSQNTDDVGRDDKNGDNIDDEGSLATMIKKSTKEDDNSNDCEGDEQQRSFACTDCSYNTRKKYLLLRHSKIHSGLRSHMCTICERRFTTGTSLQAHVNVHFRVKNKNCKHCVKSFNTSGELKRHVRYKHTQEKPHKCTECDYAAVERSKLQRHIRYHTGKRPYQCQHCTYSSQDTYHLKRHLRTHTGEKPYKCDNCDASYANSTSLKLHKLVHNPSASKVYSCELCPVTNARKSSLRQHIRRMHFSKTLKCKRCDETFPNRYSYRLHSKIPKNEKIFKCQLGSFTPKKFTHVDRHNNIQQGERSIEYDHSFNTNSFLLGNIKTYLLKEKPFECQKCKRTFAYKAFLTRHETFHDNEHTNKQK